MKLLTKAEIPRIHGRSYTQVASELAEEGFTTNTGLPLTTKAVSEFMLENGYRKRTTKATDKRGQRVDHAKLLEEAQDIITSTLANPLKVKMLKALLADA